jgi:hypothetical protein
LYRLWRGCDAFLSDRNGSCGRYVCLRCRQRLAAALSPGAE